MTLLEKIMDIVDGYRFRPWIYGYNYTDEELTKDLEDLILEQKNRRSK